MKYISYLTALITTFLALGSVWGEDTSLKNISGNVIDTPTEEALEVLTITLKYVDGTRVAETVRPFLSPRGKIASYENKLVVSDTKKNLQRIKTIIKEIDAYDTHDAVLRERFQNNRRGCLF